MKTLVLITSAYPFGSGESFIETEFPFLHKAFSRIIIIARNLSEPQTRNLPDDVIVFRYNVSSTFSEFMRLPILLVRNSLLICWIINQELSDRKSRHCPLGLRKKIFLIRKLIKAFQFKEFIDSKIHSLGIFSDIVFYSYWLTTSAHSIGLLDYKRCLKISRAHGSDLYEEKSPLGYLPLLKFVSERLDSIFFVSEHGKNYFYEKTASEDHKLTVSRLGISAPVVRTSVVSEKDIITIVSCSNLVPLKRVGLIIEALGCIKIIRKIKWIHLGDGPLRHNLENLAESLLEAKENIRYEFKGRRPNNEILEFYSNNRVDLFLNASSSEGIPVSIMEAQSFGIPVIATDTGGVNELVAAGTGFLLPVDFKPEDLAEKICLYLKMTEEEIKKIRNNAIQNQKSRFDANKNYTEFIKKVNRIFESAFK
jgi:glycosyltransferase involved in cell wall biosynthesis